MVSPSNHGTSRWINGPKDRRKTTLADQRFDPDALSLLEAQARRLHSAKRFAGAVDLPRKVLAARLEHQGETHFQTIDSRSGRDRALRAVHRYDECVELYTENIRILREKLGPGPPPDAAQP